MRRPKGRCNLNDWKLFSRPLRPVWILVVNAPQVAELETSSRLRAQFALGQGSPMFTIFTPLKAKTSEDEPNTTAARKTLVGITKSERHI